MLETALPARGQQFDYRGFHFTNERDKRVSIPFELHSNLIVVPVRINQGEELKFILDTGVRTAILTNEIYVDSIPRPQDRVITLMGAGNAGRISAYVSSNVSFSLPEGVKAIGNSLLVLKEDYLQLDSFLGVRIHGIIGYELFSRFVVEIDYIHQKLVLHKPEHFRPRRSFKAIDMTVEDTKPYIEACRLKANDSTYVPLRLLVDTGASHSLLLHAYTSDSLEVPEKNIEGYLGRGLSGEIYGFLGRVEALQFDEYELEGVIASFPEETEMSRSILLKAGQNGNIGGSILKRFRVILDYANEKMYIKKNRLFKKDFEYNMSGMELMATGPLLATYRVAKITRGSPADKAGLREGDLVISVNGRRPPELNLGVYGELVNKRPGKRIRVKILRDGRLLKKKFRLERVI